MSNQVVRVPVPEAFGVTTWTLPSCVVTYSRLSPSRVVIEMMLALPAGIDKYGPVRTGLYTPAEGRS